MTKTFLTVGAPPINTYTEQRLGGMADESDAMRWAFILYFEFYWPVLYRIFLLPFSRDRLRDILEVFSPSVRKISQNFGAKERNLFRCLLHSTDHRLAVGASFALSIFGSPSEVPALSEAMTGIPTRFRYAFEYAINAIIERNQSTAV